MLAAVITPLSVALLLAGKAAAATADGDDTGRMVLVFDSSGSMKERAASGETKIAAAKKALNQVIGSLPEQQAVGLRVYGADVFSRSDPGACTDSELVVPVETGNRDSLRSAVASYRPYGETPIGYALQEAGRDLGNEGKRTIVLVSDGEPTCAPDPCKVARDLARKGVNLEIDVVGLDVDGGAREKLQCIAVAGDGTYYDVDSSEELATSLEKLATRAARPFTAIGNPVSGTPSTADAPLITAGDWLDEVGPTENDLTKTYEVRREIPGSTLHVSASLRTASSNGEKVEVHLTLPGGTDCGLDVNFTQLSGGQLLAAGTSASNVTTFGDVEEDSPCTSASSVIATVTNDATSTTVPRPLEVRVIEEPPAQNETSLPKPATDATWTPPPSTGATSKLIGGSSFDDAPLLDSGVYRDAIVPGEVLTYQVEADWGQNVSATVDFPSPLPKLAAAIGNLDMFARLDVFGPGRESAGVDGTVGSPTSQAFVPNQDFKLGTVTTPVTYLNRGGSHPQAGVDLAGRYTVTLFMEEDPDNESYLMPFTLRVGVNGRAQPGPKYVEEPVAPPSASPQPTSVTTAPPPSQDQDQNQDNASADPDNGLNVGSYVGALVAVGMLSLLGVGYYALRRRPSNTG
jgi:Ca-activated chloride channel family protein